MVGERSRLGLGSLTAPLAAPLPLPCFDTWIVFAVDSTVDNGLSASALVDSVLFGVDSPLGMTKPAISSPIIADLVTSINE